MDTITIYTPNLSTPKTNSSPPKPALRQVIREATDQMPTHTRKRRAKRASPSRSTAITGNCPVQKHHLTHNPTPQEQITMGDIEYSVFDISADHQARDYVISLGYCRLPVVVAGDDHWSGFRPDRIRELNPAATRAAS